MQLQQKVYQLTKENQQLKQENESQNRLIQNFFSILDDIHISETMSTQKAEMAMSMILCKVEKEVENYI